MLTMENNILKIELNKIGKILNGKEQDHYVEIIPEFADHQNSPFLVIISPQLDFSVAYDDWVPNLQALNQYLFESGWIINWDFNKPRSS